MNACPVTCSAAGKILLVDDEPQILSTSIAILASAGFDGLVPVEDSRNVIPMLSEPGEPVSVVVLDLLMPHISGLQILQKLTADFPQIPVIVMTGANDVESAISCMKAGAVDYLIKPVEATRLVSAIKKTLEIYILRSELASLKEHLLGDVIMHEDAFSPIITCSGKMKKIFQYLEAIAPTTHAVMITGETGTGKELVAHSVHRLSKKRGDLIAVNVAGLDDAMFSDTLFGHRKGAFTGAEQARRGLISQAENGTLFLDEIGDLSPSSQVKLLRLLQDNVYYPLGSDTPVKSGARIVTATNKDCNSLVEKGILRKDLFYRLCSHQVHIPPLRERPEDIPLLLDHFIDISSRSFDKEKPVPHPMLAEFLSTYDFPGNVRELEMTVYDAVAQHKSGLLTMEMFKKQGKSGDGLSVRRAAEGGDLPPEFDGNEPGAIRNIFGHFPTISEATNYLVQEATRLSKGNQAMAASLLGVTRQALNKRLKKKL
jgi:two-component system response regulator HydG